MQQFLISEMSVHSFRRWQGCEAQEGGRGGAWLGAELALQLEYLYGHITPNVGTLCKQQRIGSKIQMRIRIRPMCNVCAGVCVCVRV